MRIYLDFNASTPVPPEVAARGGSLPEKRLRRGAELVQAALTAEVVRPAQVVDVPDRIVRRDGHPTDRVEDFGSRDCMFLARHSVASSFVTRAIAVYYTGAAPPKSASPAMRFCGGQAERATRGRDGIAVRAIDGDPRADVIVVTRHLPM